MILHVGNIVTYNVYFTRMFYIHVYCILRAFKLIFLKLSYVVFTITIGIVSIFPLKSGLFCKIFVFAGKYSKQISHGYIM